MVDRETLVSGPCKWNSNFRQTVGPLAVGACKMRVALGFGAVVSKFIMPGSVAKKRFVYQAGLDKTFKNTVYRYFVRGGRAEFFYDLLGGLRAFGP